nr:Holliday junction resolvase RuvX [Clostridia bacterium]
MKKILGVDLGDVRTGLALSDALGSMAHGIKTVRPKGAVELIGIIKQLCEENGAETVVVGNPVNMDGSHGPRSEKATKFAERLRDETGLEVILFDERMTTMAAARFMNETDTRGKKRKDSIDTLSAEIILQNYLDSLKLSK